MDIWTYVITHDYGIAPNYERPFTTLALCKPKIRRTAKVGDVVLAFFGAGMNNGEPHSVCWAGLVSEVLTFAQYWNDPRFQRKKPDHSQTPDNIYRPERGDSLTQMHNGNHHPPDHAVDTGGKNVLVFKKWWHADLPVAVLPAKFGLHIRDGRRGHRRHDVSPAKLQELQKWLGANVPKSRKLHRPATRKSCGDCKR